MRATRSATLRVYNGRIDGRFAPSPTSRLHVGNLRTALLAWLFARSAGSRFVLRIEDLDPDRSKLEFETEQLGDLAAIGLDWDGEVVRQSERTALYRDALGELEAAGRVYPCWCTRAEIRAAAGAPHSDLPEGAYPGTCRDLTPRQRQARAEETGREPALRLDARTSGVDDFVLRRADGVAAYNLAVVVDDADQGIEQVVRGDDLVDTTPRQVLLQELLGLPTPAYAHVPLVLGEDGRRLAKRRGAVTLADVSPGEAVAWMAHSLGLANDGERPTAGELVGRFAADRLPSEPTRFIRVS